MFCGSTKDHWHNRVAGKLLLDAYHHDWGGALPHSECDNMIQNLILDDRKSEMAHIVHKRDVFIPKFNARRQYVFALSMWGKVASHTRNLPDSKAVSIVSNLYIIGYIRNDA